MMCRYFRHCTGLQCGDGQTNRDGDTFSWRLSFLKVYIQKSYKCNKRRGFCTLGVSFCLFYHTFCVTASAAFSAAAGVARGVQNVKASKKIATLCCRKTTAIPERRQFFRCRRVSIFLPRVALRGTASLDDLTSPMRFVVTVARERATLHLQPIMGKERTHERNHQDQQNSGIP